MSNSIPCFAIWLNAVFLLLYTVNTFMTFGNCNRNCCRLCYHFHFLIQLLFMGFRALAVTLRRLHIQIIRLSNHLVGLFLVIIIFVVVAVNAITISRPQHSLLAAHRSVQVFFSLCFVLCCIASMLQIKLIFHFHADLEVMIAACIVCLCIRHTLSATSRYLRISMFSNSRHWFNHA